jgi:protein-S-isoprenylcysteine O-methyltransferase Ste14
MDYFDEIGENICNIIIVLIRFFIRLVVGFFCGFFFGVIPSRIITLGFQDYRFEVFTICIIICLIYFTIGSIVLGWEWIITGDSYDSDEEKWYIKFFLFWMKIFD